MIQIFLCSSGITLRNFYLEDLNAFFDLTHSPLVRKYVPGAYTENHQEAEKLLTNYITYDFVNDFYFAIIDDQSGKLIGALLANRPQFSDTTMLEVAYFIHPEYRNRGICTTALRMFISYLESHNTNYQELFFEVNTDNHSSRRVLEKIGITVNTRHDFFHYPLSPHKGN